MIDVYMDGKLMGSTKSPKNLVEEVKKKRRAGLLPDTVNVGYSPEYKEVHVNTDVGRMRRPLIVVEDGKSKLTEPHVKKVKKGELSWDDLVKQGIIEYLDAEEEENALVAIKEEHLNESHTHLEIHPSIILGLPANLIPFSSHNRADRVNISSKMLGQSLGIYSSSFHRRTDTKSNILVYSQMPLVSTTVAPFIGLESHPQGQNIIMAIMPFEGYNIEDAVIVNKASIERGFGRSFFFRTYETEEKKYWGIEKDEIKIPDKSVKGYLSDESYANLAEDGIINPETEVGGNEVLIGKVSPLRFFGPMESFMLETENRRETSITTRPNEKGIVDKVLVSQNADGNKIVKVTIREERIPELGDKFASRHGQKGVIGLIVPEEDMPFTKDGVIPDIIINPHALPSRMTVAQLLELMAGKVSALAGEKMDGTAFDATPEEKLKKVLKEFGFRSDGKERMYDGKTGKPLKASVFIGNCYYQKLHHMVAGKMHARGRGPVTLLTRQPTEGRAKEGGLRLGEMEKDCLLGHGASLLLKERFSADQVKVPVCNRCGLIAIEDHTKGRTYCPVCKKSDTTKVSLSYAFKLLLDEMKCMILYPKLEVKG